ncbi:hypothetical protein [Streptomyces sp.]|uniref:hypothetical protein n=1 Tax=Streptomyces sp. TaxID=1931 RepID=UPI002F42B3CF
MALVTGCSLGTHTHVPATAPTVSASALPPVGSIEHPRPVECVDGMSDRLANGSPPPAWAAPPTRYSRASGPTTPTGAPSTGPSAAAGSDVTVGPLTWKGLGTLATGRQTTYGIQNSDGWHYRIGPDIRSGAVVTVVIGTEQRARAGLEYGGGYGTSPAPAVTFHGCAGSTTTFPGGFFVAGNGRACVPVDVRIGDGAPRRVMISFFNGDCPSV